jgi:hypothetical protein
MTRCGTISAIIPTEIGFADSVSHQGCLMGLLQVAFPFGSVTILPPALMQLERKVFDLLLLTVVAAKALDAASTRRPPHNNAPIARNDMTFLPGIGTWIGTFISPDDHCPCSIKAA